MNDLAHSNEVGGSSMPKRLNCPLSRYLESQAPKTEASEYALRGSMLHAVMELLLVNEVTNIKEAQPLIDEAIGQHFGFGDDYKLTDDLVATKIGPALTAWFELCEEYDIVDFVIEVRVNIDHIIEGAFGTADIIAIDSEGRLHIVDWKFGDGVPVPAEGNVSLGFYGICALEDQEDEDLADMLADLYEDCDVFLHIIQPRTGYDEPALDTWATDEGWLNDLLDQLVKAMEASYAPDPVAKPGEWCRWCAGAPMCEAQQQTALAVVKKDPHGMTGVELAKWLDLAIQVEKWKAQLFEYALAEMEGGASVPGYKLVQKRAQRKWVDAEVVEATCKKKRLKVDQMYNKVLKSPAQMEKAAKNVYSKSLAEMVVSVSSGVTLVNDSDPRPAVTDSMQLLANALEDSNTKH